jgi:hypothetical protein
MNDYVAIYPLWDDGGGMSEDPDELVDQLGVTHQLLDDLRRWQAEWEDRPRTTEAHRAFTQRHRSEGEVLTQRLRDELTIDVRVVFKP